MAIVTNGLIGYWHALQGVNGTTWDNIAPETSPLYPMTLSGSGTHAVDANGMVFNGTNDKALNNSFDASPTTFTIEILYTPAVMGGSTVSGRSSAIDEFYTALFSSGNMQTNWRTNSNSIGYYSAGGHAVNTQVLDSIVWDGTNFTLYVNGAFNTSSDSSIVFKLQTRLAIGVEITGASSFGGYYNGRIIAVRVYNRVLTAAEVAQNYQNGTAVGLSATPVVVHMGETQGTAVATTSGTGVITLPAESIGAVAVAVGTAISISAIQVVAVATTSAAVATTSVSVRHIVKAQSANNIGVATATATGRFGAGASANVAVGVANASAFRVVLAASSSNAVATGSISVRQIVKAAGQSVAVATATINIGITVNGLLGYWNSYVGVNGTTWNNIAPATSTQYVASLYNTTVGPDGMTFDGSNEVMSECMYDVPTELQSATDYTYEVRVKLTTYAYNTGVARILGIRSANYLLWPDQPNSAWATGPYADMSEYDVYYYPATPIIDNAEYYLAFTYNVTTGSGSFYVNGQWMVDHAHPSGLKPFAGFRVSTPAYSPDGRLYGVVDNLRLYNRKLSASEIAQNYSVRRGIFSEASQGQATITAVSTASATPTTFTTQTADSTAAAVATAIASAGIRNPVSATITAVATATSNAVWVLAVSTNKTAVSTTTVTAAAVRAATSSVFAVATGTANALQLSLSEGTAFLQSVATLTAIPSTAVMQAAAALVGAASSVFAGGFLVPATADSVGVCVSSAIGVRVQPTDASSTGIATISFAAVRILTVSAARQAVATVTTAEKMYLGGVTSATAVAQMATASVYYGWAAADAVGASSVSARGLLGWHNQNPNDSGWNNGVPVTRVWTERVPTSTNWRRK